MAQKYIYINSQVYINKHETDKKTQNRVEKLK